MRLEGRATTSLAILRDADAGHAPQDESRQTEGKCNGCQRRKILHRRARPHAARRRHPRQRGEGDARPQGPQRRDRQESYGAPRITKDGVTVAKEIELEDKFENMGAQMVREVAQKTNDHGRRRHHHRDRAGAGDRARRRQVGRRRHEPDGPQARHRHRGRRRRQGHREARQEGRLLGRSRPGRHHLVERRRQDRQDDRRGDAEGRQRGRHHGRGGQGARDRGRDRRGHAVRPRLSLALLHHQCREDDGRARGRLHPPAREEALGPAGDAAGARSGGADAASRW